MRKKAYAKINLGLDVLGILPGGYHEVKMVMQTVGIFDVLTMERAKAGITVTTDSGELPTDENNLIYKAAKLLLEEAGVESGVCIYLEKHIPIAAGMAGGSSDAAATLSGINELFELGYTDEQLMELGVRIGADVPYCILGGTALAEGIGEKLTPLAAAPDCYLLVAKPPINVATGHVYKQLDSLEGYSHPDIDGMVEAIARGDLAGVVKRMGNVLQEVTIPEHPIIGELKEEMIRLGAEGSMMSGSGPTVFGIFTDRDRAQKAYESMQGYDGAGAVFLTGFVRKEERDAE